MQSLIESPTNLEMNSEDVTEIKIVNVRSSHMSSSGKDNINDSNNAKSEAIQMEFNEIDEDILNENKTSIFDKTANYDSMEGGKFHFCIKLLFNLSNMICEFIAI